MSKKLLNMPLTRAYLITTAIAVTPALAFAGYYLIRVMQAGTDVEQIRAVTDGRGTVAPGAVEMFSAPQNVWVWVGGVLLTFLFAGALIRIVLGNVTIKTVDRMVVQMRSAADGDLSEVPRPSMRNEYGELQVQFARLVENFQSTITRIDRAARELKGASEEMSHTSDEAGQAIGEVAQAIGAISEGAGHQVGLVGRSAEHIDSIETAVRAADGFAAEVLQQTRSTAQLADAGAESTAAVETSMQELLAAGHETAKIIRELGDRSNDIDSIVQSIADIATQTNMLALNASIEAARAGEQGRGFANVAEEVRTLAEDAQRAVAEIGAVVGEISQQTDGAIAATEAGIERVEFTAQTVVTNRQVFADISKAIHDLGDRSAEIGDLIAGIVNAASRARQHVSEVAVVAEQSSSTTEEVSAATQQTSAAAQEVTASAQHVAGTAALLAELSGRFKLPEREAA